MKFLFMIFFIFIAFHFGFAFLSIICSAVVYYILDKRQGRMNGETVISSVKKKKKNRIETLISNICHGINFISGEYVGSIPSHFARDCIYKFLFRVKMDIGKNGVHIYKGVQFRDGFNCKIGNGSIIGDHSILDARGGLEIGRDVNLSSEVRIWTGQHNMQDAFFSYESAKVTIGDRSWISSNTIILPGVAIGEGAVICAGAVVTKNCDKYGIYAGVPAKRIGTRNQELKYHFNEGTIWFY